MKDLLNLYGEERVAEIRSFRRAQSQEEMRSLRQSSSKKNIRPIWDIVGVALSQKISHLLLILMPPAAKNSMCKYYGHVIDHSTWSQARLPRCAECNAVIKGAESLRKAIAC
ncbi:MAG: hypothetical protein K2X77_17305 [Candidatus Obscuribacterales bacterium]|jgi:hypothetical protein|nr:hypothetical protein [Candidatus Obscuribacterales bacterium]